MLHCTYPYASLVDTSFLTTAGYIAGAVMVTVKTMVMVMVTVTVMRNLC